MAELNLCIGMLALLCGLASMGSKAEPLNCQIETNGMAKIRLGSTPPLGMARYSVGERSAAEQAR